MKLHEIVDFLNKAKLGKYMTSSKFLLSLRPHDHAACICSARNGETLHDCIKRWAAQHAPDVTIVDDDDGEDHSSDYKIVDDEDDL